MNFRTFASRNSTDPPLRSCNQNEKPPEFPSPGIAGGMNANASASGISVINRPFSRFTIDLACCATERRSSQGLSAMKKNAVLSAETREMRLNPAMVVVPSMPSVSFMIFSMRRHTSSVRASDAAGGSCTLRKKNP